MKSFFEILNDPLWEEKLDWYAIWKHLLKKKALLFGGAMNDPISERIIPILQRNVFSKDVALVTQQLERFISKAGGLSTRRREIEQHTELDRLIDKVMKFIAENQLKMAIEFCLNCENEKFHQKKNNFILLRSRYSALMDSDIRGETNSNELSSNRNKIASDLLKLMDECKDTTILMSKLGV